jgi:3'-phosphoadenosine 5'-phosphosulfate (PAPS) 3'-phosphatase
MRQIEKQFGHGQYNEGKIVVFSRSYPENIEKARHQKRKVSDRVMKRKSSSSCGVTQKTARSNKEKTTRRKQKALPTQDQDKHEKERTAAKPWNQGHKHSKLQSNMCSFLESRYTCFLRSPNSLQGQSTA